jgi:hypothetical protein
MNNIEEIKQFKCIDGSIFNYLDEAEKYNDLLKLCDDIELAMISRPEDIDFTDGCGWIQHPKSTKIRLQEDVIKLYNKWFSADAKNMTHAVSKTIDDNGIKCLNHLMYRFQCMSYNDKEYGQPYYATHPIMATGGQIN